MFTNKRRMILRLVAQ